MSRKGRGERGVEVRGAGRSAFKVETKRAAWIDKKDYAHCKLFSPAPINIRIVSMMNISLNELKTPYSWQSSGTNLKIKDCLLKMFACIGTHVFFCKTVLPSIICQENCSQLGEACKARMFEKLL